MNKHQLFSVWSGSHSAGLQLVRDFMRDFMRDYGIVNFLGGNTGVQMGGCFSRGLKR